jgi:hypothetical protein
MRDYLPLIPPLLLGFAEVLAGPNAADEAYDTSQHHQRDPSFDFVGHGCKFSFWGKPDCGAGCIALLRFPGEQGSFCFLYRVNPLL